ncbi:class IV adenylate cyclase [Nocardiopsis trehalosi]|uniref:class IV adenylate cyclase n=1 Tax=Nocardiopsis trehalosi TaxID=109329 RepID=UPI000ABAC6F9|nr:class IV adenylate cyclase [Nocardiopsis trehalosi]
MIEVERKRAIDASDQLTARLMACGWRAVASSTEVDTYYSRPDVDYLETVECLRVRRRGDAAEITYKPASTGASHSAAGVIAKRETNVALAGGAEAGDAEALLEAIGMVPLARVEKLRTVWRHENRDDVAVALDVIVGAGAFVEVEVLSADVGRATTELAAVETELGLTEAPVVELPYRDIVRDATTGAHG